MQFYKQLLLLIDGLICISITRESQPHFIFLLNCIVYNLNESSRNFATQVWSCPLLFKPIHLHLVLEVALRLTFYSHLQLSPNLQCINIYVYLQKTSINNNKKMQPKSSDFVWSCDTLLSAPPKGATTPHNKSLHRQVIIYRSFIVILRPISCQ